MTRARLSATSWLRALGLWLLSVHLGVHLGSLKLVAGRRLARTTIRRAVPASRARRQEFGGEAETETATAGAAEAENNFRGFFRMQLVTRAVKILANGVRETGDQRVFPPPIMRTQDFDTLGLAPSPSSPPQRVKQQEVFFVRSAAPGESAGGAAGAVGGPGGGAELEELAAGADQELMNDMGRAFSAPSEALLPLAPAATKCRLFGSDSMGVEQRAKIACEFAQMQGTTLDDFLLEQEAQSAKRIYGPNSVDAALAGEREAEGAGATTSDVQKRWETFDRSVGAVSFASGARSRGSMLTREEDWLEDFSNYLPECPVLSLTSFYRLRARQSGSEVGLRPHNKKFIERRNRQFTTTSSKKPVSQVQKLRARLFSAAASRLAAAASTVCAAARTPAAPHSPAHLSSALALADQRLRFAAHTPDCPPTLAAKVRPKNNDAEFRVPVQQMVDGFEVLLRQLNARKNFIQVHGIPLLGSISCFLSGEERSAFLNIAGEDGVSRSAADPRWPAPEDVELASVELHDSLRCALGTWFKKTKVDIFFRFPLVALHPLGLAQTARRRQEFPDVVQKMGATETADGSAGLRPAADLLQVRVVPQARIKVDTGVHILNKLQRDFIPNASKFVEKPLLEALRNTGLLSAGVPFAIWDTNVGSYVRSIVAAVRKWRGEEFGRGGHPNPGPGGRGSAASSAPTGPGDATLASPGGSAAEEEDEGILGRLGLDFWSAAPTPTGSNADADTPRNDEGERGFSLGFDGSAFLDSDWEARTKRAAHDADAWFLAGGKKPFPATNAGPGADGTAEEEEDAGESGPQMMGPGNSAPGGNGNDLYAVSATDVAEMSPHDLFVEGAPRHRVTYPQMVVDVTQWPQSRSKFQFAVTCRIDFGNAAVDWMGGRENSTEGIFFGAAPINPSEASRASPASALPPCGFSPGTEFFENSHPDTRSETRVEMWQVTADVGSVETAKASRESEYVWTLVERYLEQRAILAREELERTNGAGGGRGDEESGRFWGQEQQDRAASPAGALEGVLASAFQKRRNRLRKFLQNDMAVSSERSGPPAAVRRAPSADGREILEFEPRKRMYSSAGILLPDQGSNGFASWAHDGFTPASNQSLVLPATPRQEFSEAPDDDGTQQPYENRIRPFDFHSELNVLHLQTRKFQAEVNFGLHEILRFALRTVEVVTPDVPLPFGIKLRLSRDYVLRYGTVVNKTPPSTVYPSSGHDTTTYSGRTSTSARTPAPTTADDFSSEDIEDEFVFFRHRLRVSNGEELRDMLRKGQILFELLNLRIPAVVSWRELFDVELVIDLHGVLVKPPQEMMRKFYGVTEEDEAETRDGGGGPARSDRIRQARAGGSGLSAAAQVLAGEDLALGQEAGTQPSSDARRLGVLQLFPCVTLKEMSFLNWEFVKDTVQTIVHDAVEKAMRGVNAKLHPFFFRY